MAEYEWRIYILDNGGDVIDQDNMAALPERSAPAMPVPNESLSLVKHFTTRDGYQEQCDADVYFADGQWHITGFDDGTKVPRKYIKQLAAWCGK